MFYVHFLLLLAPETESIDLLTTRTGRLKAAVSTRLRQAIRQTTCDSAYPILLLIHKQ
jgi:hypothetical protein